MSVISKFNIMNVINELDQYFADLRKINKLAHTKIKKMHNTF